MNSIASAFRADPSGTAPKQHGAVPMLELNDGNKIPMLAYGLGTANSSKSADDVIKGTTAAIKAGFFHLDGAEMYGNEKELGAAIAKSNIPRSSLFVTTKLNNNPSYPGQVSKIFSESLQRLGLDYVDLYLIHHPNTASSPSQLTADLQALQSLWAEVEALKDSGKVKSIGVSNFLGEDLAVILQSAKHKPVINQIEFHPYYQRDTTVQFCRDNNIAIAAYAPLTPIVRVKDGALHHLGGGGAAGDKSVLATLTKKYGVNEADVLLRWCIDQGVVAITTSSNEVRLESYICNVPNFKLTPKEVETISETGKGTFKRCFWTDLFKEGDSR